MASSSLGLISVSVAAVVVAVVADPVSFIFEVLLFSGSVSFNVDSGALTEGKVVVSLEVGDPLMAVLLNGATETWGGGCCC